MPVESCLPIAVAEARLHCERVSLIYWLSDIRKTIEEYEHQNNQVRIPLEEPSYEAIIASTIDKVRSKWKKLPVNESIEKDVKIKSDSVENCLTVQQPSGSEWVVSQAYVDTDKGGDESVVSVNCGGSYVLSACAEVNESDCDLFRDLRECQSEIETKISSIDDPSLEVKSISSLSLEKKGSPELERKPHETLVRSVSRQSSRLSSQSSITQTYYEPTVGILQPEDEPIDHCLDLKKLSSDLHNTPKDAFDDILSQLGTEIYKLDEYQRKLYPQPDDRESILDVSIVNLFDNCISEMTVHKTSSPVELNILVATDPASGEQTADRMSVRSEEITMTSTPIPKERKFSLGVNKIFDSGDGIPVPPKRRHRRSTLSSNSSIYDNIDRQPVKPRPTSKVESLKSYLDSDSDSETTCWSYKVYNQDADSSNQSNYSRVWICSSGFHNSDDIIHRVIKQNQANIRMQDISFEYACDLKQEEHKLYHLPEYVSVEVESDRCESVADTMPGKSDARLDNSNYEPIEPRSIDRSTRTSPLSNGVCSGFHNVLPENEPVIKASDQKNRQKLTENGDYEVISNAVHDVLAINDIVTKKSNDIIDNDTYAEVIDRTDAYDCEENIYEEIEHGYTDEGYSCGSIEVESCSVSLYSEGARESPLYANLNDNDAYAISADVIAWKNMLLHPFYIEDEEDEWITPEESLVYGREQRPPYIIPRIRHYHAYRPSSRKAQDDYNEENIQEYQPSIKDSIRLFESRQQDWSPVSERSRLEVDRAFSEASDSPPYTRNGKRLGGSNENLLAVGWRYPQSGSSGDSLDVEVRPAHGSRRKTQSLLGPRVLSPVPLPRVLPVLMHNDESPILEGPVKKTKFGKKIRKNWSDSYLVLTHNGLVFYKDHKTYLAYKLSKQAGTPPSPTGSTRAEYVLPLLRNSKVRPCTQQHTSRYARSLLVSSGEEQVLIQDESAIGAERWLHGIERAISFLPYELQANNNLESLKPSPMQIRKNRSKTKVGDSSNEDLSDSTEASNVRAKLKKFFTRRPTMESLVKKGIYKDEPVFGRKLEEVCSDSPPRVPEFVARCIRAIESSEENMATDGLYRASGNLSQVQKIRLEIDQNNMAVVENSPDIHVLTGSLKLFFRELKEPLIPCKLFDRILAATGIKNRDARVKEFRDIVHSLPACNRDTLKFLLEHLLRVTEYKDRNRMHTSNLAIVFGPTLMWAPAELAHNIAIDCIQQNHAIEILLTDFHLIFDEKSKKK